MKEREIQESGDWRKKSPLSEQQMDIKTMDRHWHEERKAMIQQQRQRERRQSEEGRT